MYEDYTPTISEEERQARHRQRAEARRRRKLERRRQMLFKAIPVAFIAAVAIGLLTAWGLHKQPSAPSLPEEPVPVPKSVQTAEPVPEPEPAVYSVSATADTVQLGDTVDSSYAVLIDEDSGTILAEKDAGARISPASMTKVLTLLVGAEHVADHLDDTFTMTIDITDYCYVNKCSVVGLMVGETVPVRELLYGTILPSGADAALGLAVYVSGSQEAFVELMNQKLEELVRTAREKAGYGKNKIDSTQYSKLFRQELASSLINLALNDIGLVDVSDKMKEKTGTLQSQELGFLHYRELIHGLKDIVFRCINHNDEVYHYEQEGRKVICFLKELYSGDRMYLPPEYRAKELIKQYDNLAGRDEGELQQRLICDYIAGMMDSYAIAVYEKFSGQKFNA